MTQEKRNAIAEKNGLAITPDGQYIGMRSQWTDFDNDITMAEEIEEMALNEAREAKAEVLEDEMTPEEEYEEEFGVMGADR